MEQKAKKILEKADNILITAGAGFGVDSGLPDFRGVEGFWRAYPIAKKLNLRFEELANPIWFEKEPTLAWAFYGHRLELYRKTTPHIGFTKLLNFAKSKRDYFVVTSNVDGQFQKAGFDEEKIEEIHGSIHHLQCSKPCSHNIWSANDIKIKIDENFRAIPPLPKCKSCKAIARPNILMFGDWNFVGGRTNRQHKNFIKFLQNLQGSLVIIEFGAGKAVPTIRNLSETVMNSYNANLIRINPRDYNTPNGAIAIDLGAKDAIYKLIDSENG